MFLCYVFFLCFRGTELTSSLEKKTVQESPVNASDNELISKPKTENEQESAVNATDNELISKLKTENEQLKV